MTRNNCWLPELNEFLQTSFTVASYKEYEASLYCTYKKDFWSNDLFFQGLKVQVRKSPIIDGYEESFVHFTCKNYENVQNREPDFRRCERLHWIRQFIENYQCKAHCVEECGGIKYCIYIFFSHVVPFFHDRFVSLFSLTAGIKTCST